MSRADAQMPSARRRPIPGMTSADELAPVARSDHASDDFSAPGEGSPVNAPEVPAREPRRRPGAPSATSLAEPPRRRPSTDYASTRLVNFRIPVDLHDRYKRLVRDVEQKHLRLRHPSLTELLIGLLEEGPDTANEVAAVIRRKRASEHGSEEDA
jgi:hypothetical protein